MVRRTPFSCVPLDEPLEHWSNLAIIFMGKELADDLEISDCDLGDYSVIHALDSHKVDKVTGQCGNSKLNQRLTTVDEGEPPLPSTSRQEKYYFFVYCKHCSAARNGKLRVVCDTCGQSSLLCLDEPQNWADVLQPRRIRCKCLSHNCTGTWARFFFKCIDENSHKAPDEPTLPLTRLRHNNIHATCLACTELSSKVVLVFPCDHVICVDCFADYCRSSISERNLSMVDGLGFTVDCPLNCAHSWLEPAHFHLLDHYFYSLYEKVSSEEKVLQQGGIFCPHPDCGEAYFPAALLLGQCQLVECAKCRLCWCAKCTYERQFQSGLCQLETLIEERNSQWRQQEKANTEQPQSETNEPTYLRRVIDKFDILRRIGIGGGGGDRTATLRWQDNLSKSKIQEIAKPCPKCRMATERSGGCMHMVCARKWCNFHWCWICQQEWSRDCMTDHWFG